MIRVLLLFILIVLVYQAVKTVVRSAIRAASEPDERPRLQGEEMVLDPHCRTYVVKGRSVSRRIDGVVVYFCSSGCAEAFEHQRRR